MCIPRSFLKDIKDGGEDDLQDEVYENPPVGTLNDLVRKTVNIIVVEFNSQSGTVEFNIYNAEDATEVIDESRMSRMSRKFFSTRRWMWETLTLVSPLFYAFV